MYRSNLLLAFFFLLNDKKKGIYGNDQVRGKHITTEFQAFKLTNGKI